MAPVTGFKQFVDGVPLFASELNGYLRDQTVMRFANTTNLRTSLNGNAGIGQLAWADSTATLYMWNGSNWRACMSDQKPWSPTWTGSVTNPQKGTSQESAQWRVVGVGLVEASWKFFYNGTFVIGSGNYAWTLPVACDNDTMVPLGQGGFSDSSGGPAYFMRTATNLGSAGSFVLISESGVRSGAAAPVAPAAGDLYQVDLLYRTSDLDLAP